MIGFFVDGTPVAKARPRVTKTGHTYTPKKTVAWENTIALEAGVAMTDKAMFTKPVIVTLNFFFRFPKSFSRLKHIAAETGEIIPMRGDIDNYAKAALDAMNGVVYKDDRQIGCLHLKKRYGLKPGVDVTVSDTV
jgi:Holliday junction resolvase RusA-like endonuclease